MAKKIVAMQEPNENSMGDKLDRVKLDQPAQVMKNRNGRIHALNKKELVSSPHHNPYPVHFKTIIHM